MKEGEGVFMQSIKLIGELKSYKAKSLVSGDKSIELKFHVNANDNINIDVSTLHRLLLTPLEVTIKESCIE